MDTIQPHSPEKTTLNRFIEDEQGLKYDPTTDPKDRYAGDNGCQAGDWIPYWIKFAMGAILTLNFIIFWGAPIFVQGQAWRHVLHYVGTPIWNYFDNHPVLRNFASKYIYSKERFADYFLQSICVLISFIPMLIYIIHQQVTYGQLSWAQIYAFNFAWVGLRAGTLGGTYSLAHREGHSRNLYQPWIRKSIGNFFENVMGPFFGSVPYNFSTTHNFLHHPLQARSGDSFYQYDVDRNSVSDFMILLARIALHCAGFTAYNQMRIHGLKEQCRTLLKGMVQYYFIYPAILLALTRSWSFLFYIYFQPFVGMTFFLCFMNIAFHAFVEYDEHGRPVEVVYSTEMIGGADDYFAENSHLTHHYAGHVYWRDVNENRKKMYPDFAKYHGAVFTGLSIVEVAAFILFGQWETLADHFVQYNDKPAPNKLPEDELIRLGSEDLSAGVKQSVWVGQGKLTKREVVAMLRTRAKRREPRWLRCELLKNEQYFGYDDTEAKVDGFDPLQLDEKFKEQNLANGVVG